MSVTPIRGVSDAELLRLALRRAGYVHPDEIMELDDDGWCLAASNAGLHDSPNTATRCATRHLFGSPSLLPPHVSPERVAHPFRREAVTEPEGCGIHGDAVHAPFGSTSERRA